MTVVTTSRTDLTLVGGTDVEPAGVDELAEARAATEAAQHELAAATHAVIVASEYVARAALLVARAKAVRAHELLCDPDTGKPYRTWARYCEVELPGLRTLRIELDTRVQLVSQLVGAGLSRREVGHALGRSDQTVRADLTRAAEAAALTAGPTFPAAVPGEVLAETEAPAPSPTRASNRATLLVELDQCGPEGMTSAEGERRHPRWTPAVWSVLSQLHRDGLVERLAATEPTGTRKGRAVYVMGHHRGEREVEAPGQGRRKRKGA